MPVLPSAVVPTFSSLVYPCLHSTVQINPICPEPLSYHKYTISLTMSNDGLRILSLYKQILRLHQQKLPEIPRAIGDRYVRQEFRAHKKVTPEQQKQFILQWTDYIAHLGTEVQMFGLGRDLPQDVIDSMNEQQQQQLQKIHENATKLGSNKSESAQMADSETVVPGSNPGASGNDDKK